MFQSRFTLVPTLVVAFSFVVTGCAFAPTPEDIDARSSSVEVLETSDLGPVLVDGKGAVLYVFAPDLAAEVSCTFTCATNWPPFLASDTKAAAASDGVDQALLGTAPNPAGGKVITYNGWPLYRYAADKRPGEHRGHDRYLNGGEWFVMAPSGEPRAS